MLKYIFLSNKECIFKYYAYKNHLGYKNLKKFKCSMTGVKK